MASISESEMTAERVRFALDYDPETGIFRWKHRTDRDTSWNNRFAGNPAGGPSGSENRIVIRLDDRKLYLASRLAWLYMTGEWPKDKIDHKSGDSSDNRFRNLREATHAQNMCNRKRDCDNQSGFLGVRFREHHGKFEGRIHRGGKTVWRGYFDSAQEAAAARRAMVEKIDGEFATYHRDH